MRILHDLAAQFVLLLEEVQQEALSVIAAQNEPAKEIMRETVHNHRAQDAQEATGATAELLNLSPLHPLVCCLVLNGYTVQNPVPLATWALKQKSLLSN